MSTPVNCSAERLEAIYFEALAKFNEAAGVDDLRRIPEDDEVMGLADGRPFEAFWRHVADTFPTATGGDCLSDIHDGPLCVTEWSGNNVPQHINHPWGN